MVQASLQLKKDRGAKTVPELATFLTLKMATGVWGLEMSSFHWLFDDNSTWQQRCNRTQSWSRHVSSSKMTVVSKKCQNWPHFSFSKWPKGFGVWECQVFTGCFMKVAPGSNVATGHNHGRGESPAQKRPWCQNSAKIGHIFSLSKLLKHLESCWKAVQAA